MDAGSHQEIARELFRESNDALFLFDPRTHCLVDVNPAALRLTGFDRKAALGLRVWDLFAGEGPADLEALMDAYQRTGFFHAREGFRMSRAAGEPIGVNLSVSRIHTRPHPLGLAVARDVTGARKAQETLDRFFGLAPDLFCILEHKGRFLRVNRAWEAQLGHSPEDLLGADPFDFVHPEDVEATRRASDSLERGTVWDFRNRWRHRDGSYRTLSWRAVRSNGLVYAVARDVTKARRLEEIERQSEALRLAKELAEQASRAKTEFLARMSHELRTPMTSILGYTEVLLDDEAVERAPHRVGEALRTIHSNGLYLLDLLNDLLDLSRIEAGQLRVEPGPCDPLGLAEEVVAALKARADARGLALAVTAEEGLPRRVLADPVRLRQVLTNLVGNAVKYTERGGVRVGLRAAADGRLGPALRVDVTDTGMGLSAEDRRRLFEPFFRTDAARRREPGGAGLGLTISRRLVELLGGRMEVDSAPGLGSTFSVLLPLAEPAPADGPAPASARAPAAAPAARLQGRVLVAEDTEANRRVIRLQIERLGAQVEEAGDGGEALAKALEARDAGSPFDAILMDMQMPVMGGLEATRRLREAGYRGPIVALTAFAMAEDRDECLRAGCDAHVSKPIDRARLHDVLAGLLGDGT